MLKKVNKWWMALDPPLQYMYWIIAFIAMLGAMIFGLVWIPHHIPFLLSIELILIGVIGFVGLFMAVVIFLAVVWPHLYQDKD